MRTLAAMSAIILLGACSPNIAGLDITDGNGSARIAMVRLEDGTKCAVLIGSNKAAISCNWINK
jgi:hypothetical protein